MWRDRPPPPETELVPWMELGEMHRNAFLRSKPPMKETRRLISTSLRSALNFLFFCNDSFVSESVKMAMQRRQS